MPTPRTSRRLIVDGRKTEIPPLTEVGRTEFPGGPPDLPASLPSGEAPRRGRPPRQLRLSRINQERKPTGDWTDDNETARDVAAIVGNRDERLHDGAEILPRLFGLVSRLLGRKLSRVEREELRTRVLVKRAPASVITRVLVGWRYGLFALNDDERVAFEMGLQGRSAAPSRCLECRRARRAKRLERIRDVVYLELLPLMNAGRIRLLDQPDLLRELRGLERRRGTAGRDRIDHAPGQHDDRANAVAGAMCMAAGSDDANRAAIRRWALSVGSDDSRSSSLMPTASNSCPHP